MKGKNGAAGLTGGRISKLATLYHVKLKDIASAINISSSHMYNIVSGSRKLRYEDAKKIAEIYPPVRVEWILGEDDYFSADDVEEARKQSISGQAGRIRLFEDMARLAGYRFSETEETGGTIEVRQGQGAFIACSRDEEREIADEVLEFVQFKLQRLFERSQNNAE